MKAERVSYIDIAKGFVLLLVIFGHTFRDSMREAYFWCDFSYLFLYKFHGSTLFLLSGMSYAITIQNHKANSTFLYIKKKAKALMLPWVSYSLLIYIVFFIVSHIPYLSGALGNKGVVSAIEYLKLMLYNQNPYSFHLWYLNTLFLLSIAAFLIDKYFSGQYSFIFKLILIAIFPLIGSTIAQPWYLVAKGFVYQLPYFIAGTLIKRNIIEKHNKIFAAFGLLCAILLAFYSAFEKWYTPSSIGGIFVFYAENICTIAVAFGIVAVCYIFSKRLGIMERFGRNTMLYYLYHQPFCCAFVGAFLFDKLNLSVFIVIAACMAMSLIIPYLISKTAQKTALCRVLKFFGLPT